MKYYSRNKNILYVGIAVLLGLLAGWLIFGTSTEDSNDAKAISEIKKTKNEVKPYPVWR